jgi:hypothetical protein
MGSLKSIKDVPGIDYYEYRDSDYYNKYEYRARFTLAGIRYTWYTKTAEDLLKKVESGKGYYGIRPDDRTIVNTNLATLMDFIRWRNDRKIDKKAMIRIEGDTIAAFSSDLLLLKSLQNLNSDLVIDYTQVQKSPDIGVKTFVGQPKHKYRVYLKSKRVEDAFAKELNDLFSRTKGLYPSDALKYWAKSSANTLPARQIWRFRYSSASHFIDYDDESTLSYLALIHGNMLGKRYKLEKRPDPI